MQSLPRQKRSIPTRTKQMADTTQNEIDQLKKKSWDILFGMLFQI